MSKILVVNGNSYADAVKNLGDIVYDPAELVRDGDAFKLVLFTGGEDITPSFYGDTSPHNMCFYSEKRDRMETEILGIARALGIRCIGICRGVQFLNVLAGGKMYHDVSRHAGIRHHMTTAMGEEFEINSLHHQMIIPPKDSHLIGWSTDRMSLRYYGDKDSLVDGPDKEPEAVLLPSLESAGVQYHPEMMQDRTEGYKWFEQLARDLIEIEDFNDIIKKYTGAACIANKHSIQLAL